MLNPYLNSESSLLWFMMLSCFAVFRAVGFPMYTDLKAFVRKFSFIDVIRKKKYS